MKLQDLFAKDKNKIQNIELHVKQFKTNLIRQYSEYDLVINLKVIANSVVYINNFELFKPEEYSERYQLIVKIINQLLEFGKEYNVIIAYPLEAFEGIHFTEVDKSLRYLHNCMLDVLRQLKFINLTDNYTYKTLISHLQNKYKQSIPTDILIKIPPKFIQSVYANSFYVPDDKSYNLRLDGLYAEIISNMKPPITLEKIRKRLPWPNVVNRFIASKMRLTSAVGSPEIVNHDCSYYDNDISSFEGFPKVIKGDLTIGNNPFTSLKNIHYHIHEIDGYLSIPITVHSHIMGLMKIKGLKKVGYDSYKSDQNPGLQQAVEIMNRHLDGKGNFFDCLEELEDAGLEEFAQL